jgi:hypothetical protein
MADVKVRAKYRGQKPDFTWAEEGEVFEIDAKLFSERWMEKVTAKEAKAKAEPVEKTDE